LQSPEPVARTSRKPQQPRPRIRHSPRGRDAGGGHFPVPFRATETGVQPMFGSEMPLWVMGLMLLAVIGLIVLLIYLRKKDRE